MCKNLPVLNLPNQGDDLVLKIDASNEHWSAVIKINEGEKLCKFIVVEVLMKHNATIP